MKISSDLIRSVLALEKNDLHSSIVLLSAAFLPTLHRYLGSMEFAKLQIGLVNDWQAVLFTFITAFMIFGFIPYLIIRFIFSDSIRSYGVRLGDWRLGIRFTLPLIFIISLIVLLPASQTSDMRNFYPLDRSIHSLSFKLIELQIWRGVFFYTAWEFFFRGFMLFGLRRIFGDWKAICIQTIPQCLWHIGMPSGEIFFSILGGILFGVLALRTNSILWPLILHFLIGTITDFLIVTIV